VAGLKDRLARGALEGGHEAHHLMAQGCVGAQDQTHPARLGAARRQVTGAAVCSQTKCCHTGNRQLGAC
jgi:hypothetical protein